VTDFLVSRKDIRETRIEESDVPSLGPGQALLAVDSFGLTANNVTYAVFGDFMNYWDFFPAQDGWGRVPMWGFAEVAASEAEGLEAGARVFGYLPPSSHLVVTPAVDERGFVDEAPHRKALPATYQRYQRVDADPFYREDTEAMQMLLRPLFFTSFLIDDQLADDGLTDKGPVLVASASSKTAIGAAYLLAQREDVEVVGLTSPRNAEFVEGLGIYHRTITYDAIDSFERGPATLVDISGDGEVRASVHNHLGDDLAYSMTVGVTHWEEMGAGAETELPGPRPVFFFAPTRVDKRSEEWGAGALNERVAEAWQGFCDWTAGWLEVRQGRGFDAVEGAYLKVLEGEVEPGEAHVISLRS
jgi:Protein of unknown function (DUF2855)